MTKTLNHIIFFSSTKIRIFFQQHWESEYFFRKKTYPFPPFKLNGRSLTGSYIFQSNRIKMFKNESNILCLLCSKDKENIEHFILDCERLEEVRKPIHQEIEEILNDKETSWKCLPQDTKIQLLLDITSVISELNLDPASVANIEYCSRCLMFQLHMLRQTRILDMQGTLSSRAPDNTVRICYD